MINIRLYPKLLLLFVINCLFWTSISAQSKFETLKQEAKVQVGELFSEQYKKVRVKKNDYLEYQYAVASKRNKLEMRIAIQPIDEYSPKNAVPHLISHSKYMSIATNTDESLLVTKRFEDSKLEVFNAEYGERARLQPKNGFSEKEIATVFALFKQGHGMVYVVFLHDTITPSITREMQTMLQLVRFD